MYVDRHLLRVSRPVTAPTWRRYLAARSAVCTVQRELACPTVLPQQRNTPGPDHCLTGNRTPGRSDCSRCEQLEFGLVLFRRGSSP